MIPDGDRHVLLVAARDAREQLGLELRRRSALHLGERVPSPDNLSKLLFVDLQQQSVADSANTTTERRALEEQLILQA